MKKRGILLVVSLLFLTMGCRDLVQDEFDSFEIFDLPSNWMIEKGIPKGIHSKVFDDYEYDNDDQDLAEVKEILNSRKRVLTPSN